MARRSLSQSVTEESVENLRWMIKHENDNCLTGGEILLKIGYMKRTERKLTNNLVGQIYIYIYIIKFKFSHI